MILSLNSSSNIEKEVMLMADDEEEKGKKVQLKRDNPLKGWFQIESYKVCLMRSCSIIICEGVSPARRLLVYFYHSGEPTPDNHCNSKRTFGEIYARAEEYSWYIDILRNEKPVYAYIDNVKPSLNQITTGPEPVGEEESHH